MNGRASQYQQNVWRQPPYRGPQRGSIVPPRPEAPCCPPETPLRPGSPCRPPETPPCPGPHLSQHRPPTPQHRPPGLLQRLERGDLLMLAILYLLLSEDSDDTMLPLLAIGLYLILK